MKDKDSSLVRMSFSIEEELFAGLETLLAEHNYSNRSEFIRDMIRKQLAKRQCAHAGEVIGTLSVLCDLDASGIETKLLSTLDNAAVCVLGSSRFCVMDNCSSTMITVKGIGSDIRDLANNLRKLKGILQVEFVITSPASAGGSKL